MIITTQQFHIISHNLSKGENTTHYDNNHIQHLAIIHNRFAKYLFLKIIFDKDRLSFYNFKTIEKIESKPSKQVLVPKLCIHLDHI
jgi:hypothetical protein